jgi:hypothetical protein
MTDNDINSGQQPRPPVPPVPSAQPQPPAPPPPPAQQPENLEAELARTRSRNKALKITLALLLTLLVLLGVAGYMVYRRIMDTKEAVEEAFQAFPQQAMFQQAQQAAAASAQRPGVYYSTSMPSSSLGLFSGGLPSAEQTAVAQEKAAAAMKLMNKYADRPIVKEIMADLRKDPDMAKALSDGQGGNPISMVLGMQNSKSVQAILSKYAMRPEFLQLMMEISRDPEVSSLTRGMPGGMIPSMPAMPAGAQPVATGAQDGPGEPDEPQFEEGTTLDPSAVSGQSSQAPAKPKKRVPAPVDTE